MIIDKLIGDKKRWREYKARVKQLPPAYRAAVEGIERYLMHFGGTDGDAMAAMFEDLADLFEQSAASGTSVRAIVGDDPVEFVEAFVANYPQGSWITKERDRLVRAIAQAETQDQTQAQTQAQAEAEARAQTQAQAEARPKTER